MNYISVLLDNPKVEASYFGTFIALPLYPGHLRPSYEFTYLFEGGKKQRETKMVQKEID